ncbi:uncharacterized protein IL334_000619 [Kwoniella shivajii]|uniref:HCP-like protein n=1 Tax=Kwoniella shivajii TaxID=564305 RepID=A0ABZ1CSP0_9TREE|nr:hypothetical protein IL334_000619 [Kwoniella shivajii]
MTYRPQPPSSTTSFTPPSMNERGQGEGSLRRMPSAKDIATSSSTFVSPLTRLEVEGRSARSRANSASKPNGSTSSPNTYNQYQSQSQSQSPPPPPVPALEFGNLFRDSRYSVDSLSTVGSRLSINSYSSFDTINQSHESSINDDDDDDDDGYESPSTPKASTSTQGKSYFEQQQQNRKSSPTRGELQMNDIGKTRMPSSNSHTAIKVSPADKALTPKRSFSVTSRRAPPNPKSGPVPPQPPSFYLSQNDQPIFNLGNVPPKGRNRSVLDTRAREIPAAHHAHEREVTLDSASVHGEQGSDWGDDESQFEWVDTENAPEATNGVDSSRGGAGTSPTKRLSRLVKAAVIGGGIDGQGPKRLRKPLVIHRRAPPPPPNTTPALPSSQPNSPIRKQSSLTPIIPQPTAMLPSQLPHRSGSLRAASSSNTARRLPVNNPNIHQHPGFTRPPQEADLFIPPQAPFAHPLKRPSPLMVPMKVDDGPTSPMGDADSRRSHMSFQSVAYSFYDLDGEQSPAATPKAEGELAFPHGKYVKVSASALEREREIRIRSDSERSRGSGDAGKTPEDFVHAGIEARGKGDLAKAAWYFMRAAEGGSATGRMYWGLSLRHGWGVARDDKRAFVELRQACDDTLAEGALNFHKSPGHVKLTSQQKKAMQKELSLGMFEVGNCFLEGIGVKKSPEVAIAYLKFAAGMGDVASQEQLGFILSKGSHSIKKDMKEASKWYRMAIANGSSNTFGLAWIWKDKYMNQS